MYQIISRSYVYLLVRRLLKTNYVLNIAAIGCKFKKDEQSFLLILYTDLGSRFSNLTPHPMNWSGYLCTRVKKLPLCLLVEGVISKTSGLPSQEFKSLRGYATLYKVTYTGYNIVKLKSFDGPKELGVCDGYVVYWTANNIVSINQDHQLTVGFDTKKIYFSPNINQRPSNYYIICGPTMSFKMIRSKTITPAHKANVSTLM